MKIRNLYLICLILTLFFYPGCSTDPNEKANELFIEASQLLQDMKRETRSYSIALESFREAKEKIERIISKYKGSDLAVNLMSGQTKISGFALSELKEIENSLKQLAEAEQKPLSCALLIAKAIKYESWKAGVLADIAGKYAEAGQKEKAAQVLTQALETAKTMKHEGWKARALADIAGKYAEAGQQPCENDITILRDIVRAVMPIRNLWK